MTNHQEKNIIAPVLDLREQNFSFFGPGSKIKGEFNLSGIVKIASDIDGTMTMHPEGKLTIEREGRFIGTLYGDDIEIFGEFDGIIESKGRVIIQSSANVVGKINSKTLTIFPGALVNIEGHTAN